MATTSLNIDGIQIDNPAEYLRYLDLTDGSNASLRSRNEVQMKIKSYEPIHLQGVTSSMTALIIGIDNYKSNTIQRLKGAVADAHAMKQYLEKSLKVPQSRIRMLTENKATRKNIIDAFIALEHDRFITPDDAILIYYAGHGQEVEAPKGWDTEKKGGKIQSIVPYDFDPEDKIHVIPDYTLGWLIYNISQGRGDNITVVFDCCHAGSGTRANEADQLVRSAYLNDYSIPADLDEDLGCSPREPGGVRLATPLSGPSLSTHILLAACSAAEKAREEKERGKFTSSLEVVLKAVSPDQLTYTELLDRLENINGQNPQLEGNNRHRIVFNSRAAVPAHYPHKLHLDQSGKYILNAGAADGVCKGAQFTIYATFTDIFKKPLGTVIAESVQPFETVVRLVGPTNLELAVDQAIYAIQTRAGEQSALKIYMEMTEDLKPAFGAHLLQQRDTSANRYIISSVQDRDIAHLELRRDGNEIRFLILDKAVTKYGVTECIYKAPAIAKDLRPVLQGAAHYYYHLKRSHLNSEIAKCINLEFFKLENTGKYDLSAGGLGRPLRRPVGDSLVKNGIISLDIADDDTVYGISITNTGKKDLYPSLFYFDNSELSIKCYYTSHGRSKFTTDSPLPQIDGKLTLGFGNGGGTAFEYYIPDGRDVDVGFLKCFFSTKPIDLSKVEQDSPFSFSRAVVQRKPTTTDTWGCVTIPIVQRRAK